MAGRAEFFFRRPRSYFGWGSICDKGGHPHVIGVGAKADRRVKLKLPYLRFPNPFLLLLTPRSLSLLRSTQGLIPSTQLFVVYECIHT